MADQVQIKILKDGTIKSEIVGEVSEANHDLAEAFLARIAELTGGETVRSPRPHSHGEVEHTHTHTHKKTEEH